MKTKHKPRNVKTVNNLSKGRKRNLTRFLYRELGLRSKFDLNFFTNCLAANLCYFVFSFQNNTLFVVLLLKTKNLAVRFPPTLKTSQQNFLINYSTSQQYLCKHLSTNICSKIWRKIYRKTYNKVCDK